MDKSKIIQAICYFAGKENGKVIDTMKVYKLLWLSDRYHLRQYGRTITADEYFALPYGPVPSNAKNLIDGIAQNKSDQTMFGTYLDVLDKQHIAAKQNPDMEVFSETDRDALSLIYNTFGHKSAIELSKFSHTFPEWKHYEKQLLDKSLKNGYKIDKDLFFINKTEKSGLFVDDTEKLDFVKSVFHDCQEQ